MKIKPELLSQYRIEIGEEPVEFSELINRSDIPLDVFHYINLYYRLTPEELSLYRAACNIRNCENFWYSDTITNSRNLYNSHNILGSVFVRDSSDVSESIDVYNSKFISYANDVAHSSTISRASRIIESQEINEGGVFQEVREHFCGFMHNSRHCLFCVGMEDKEYYIFNQPVSPMEYERTKEILMSMLDEEKSKMILVKQDKHTAEERFRLNRRFDSVFNGLSSSFYGWVGTLPNYSDNTFIDLFFRDREKASN